ncbi:M90 family metallopeptidase [Olivibacter ginsenosidimutans]|uniref:M90 family metallopeptidase n=1 Tax=Olivibacter ginsenosidimutans TaxID=1176537 RepID=UPI0031E68659
MLILALLYSRINHKRKNAGIDKGYYEQLLAKHVLFYRKLAKAEKERFLDEVLQFLKEIRIEGIGTTVTDIDRILIGASAIIPIFAFPHWHYQHLTNILLYPDTFNEAFQFQGAHRNTLGMVGEGYMNGQMILSKEALYKGFSVQAGDHNTAIHEFVHLIDKNDGSIDGIPENLLDRSYVIPWIHLMHQEMKKIQAGKSDIDAYALTNQAEFFAVVSEYFFEKPEKLHEHHPELYAMLTQLFQIDLTKK